MAGGEIKVSVVIPVLDRERVLPVALASVLAQNMDAMEVLVVDDGSSDRSAEVAGRAGDARVRVIRHASRRGAAAARNTGIQASRGRYVAFLDSDDLWLDGKLETQLRELARAPSTTRAGVGAFTVRRGSGRTEVHRFAASDMGQRELLDGCFVSPGATLVVERGVFGEVGLLDEGLRRFEDWDWLLRYTRRYRLQIVPQVLAEVRAGTRPDLEVVDEACAGLLARHEGEIAHTFGREGLRRFQASLMLEQAVHAGAARPLTAARLLLAAGRASPPRLAAFAMRLVGRVLGRR